MSSDTSCSYILVLYYTRHGSIKKMANLIAKGIESVDKMTAMIRTVPEVSPITEKATAFPIPSEGPPYVKKEELRHCAGLILGSPTRFGNMAAPMKYFIDTLSDIWLSGELVNKPAALFTSTSTMHGGQETTLISMMLPLIHLGMVIVGIPYTEPALSTTQTGGTPYGPTHVVGKQNNPLPSKEEEELCKVLGKRVALLAKATKALET